MSLASQAKPEFTASRSDKLEQCVTAELLYQVESRPSFCYFVLAHDDDIGPELIEAVSNKYLNANMRVLIILSGDEENVVEVKHQLIKKGVIEGMIYREDIFANSISESVGNCLESLRNQSAITVFVRADKQLLAHKHLRHGIGFDDTTAIETCPVFPTGVTRDNWQDSLYRQAFINTLGKSRALDLSLNLSAEAARWNSPSVPNQTPS
jgi:hypothetical protein